MHDIRILFQWQRYKAVLWTVFSPEPVNSLWFNLNFALLELKKITRLFEL